MQHSARALRADERKGGARARGQLAYAPLLAMKDSWQLDLYCAAQVPTCTPLREDVGCCCGGVDRQRRAALAARPSAARFSLRAACASPRCRGVVCTLHLRVCARVRR